MQRHNSTGVLEWRNTAFQLLFVGKMKFFYENRIGVIFFCGWRKFVWTIYGCAGCIYVVCLYMRPSYFAEEERWKNAYPDWAFTALSFMGYIVGVALISFNGSRLELNPVVDFSDLAQECKTYDELIEKWRMFQKGHWVILELLYVVRKRR